MIISHSRRFIFIKTRKTAGTSVELFLSQFCDEADILTPLGNDEALREGMGPRNFRVSGSGRKNRALRLLATAIGRPGLGYGGFYAHIPAAEIRRLLGEKTWNDYFKFTIERNPWDRQVSLYHWHYRNRTSKPSFDLFIRSPLHRKISPNFDTYAIDNEIAADFVCRYETLYEDLASVLGQTGIEAKVDLPRAKGNLRTGPHWRDYYTPQTRDMVGQWYRREIEALGYSFSPNDEVE
jgi:hypothetical protein